MSINNVQAKYRRPFSDVFSRTQSNNWKYFPLKKTFFTWKNLILEKHLHWVKHNLSKLDFVIKFKQSNESFLEKTTNFVFSYRFSNILNSTKELVSVILKTLNWCTNRYGEGFHLIDYCGDRSINGPVEFRIDSGLRGLRPTRGRHTPRHYASEDDRIRGRLGRGLTTIQSQN